MSATVMSNYYFPPGGQRFIANTRYPLQNWWFAQMAQYPPPPQPDQQHYNALYPANAGAQQLLDQQDQLQYSNLNQAIYSKVETASAEQASSNHQIHNLAQDLQQQAALEEQHRQHIHQTNQQGLQQPIHGQQAATSQASQPSSHQGTPDQNQKANRLRKACDSCSIRKVKCDESGPPCRACAALDIPCTFDRPSRRRGPPNRHAEALKRRRMDETAEPSHRSGPSPPSSPTHAAQALAALSSQTSSQQISAESICPVETLDLLIDDFFTYIHPLCPFPHEPSFREAWRRREDLTNSSFLSLLASMVGTLVSSIPRKPRLHLKASRRDSSIADQTSLINRCQKVCTMARGAGYLGSDNLSVYDAATSYFLGLTGLYTFRWRQARLYLGECLTIIRTLGLHKAKEQAYTRLGRLPATVGSEGPDHEGSREQVVDNITLEMGRRIFWTLFVTIRSMQQLGTEFEELIITPPTSSDPYPPLPTEVDDFCIYPMHNEPQPAGYLPLIAGFNANVRVYSSYNSLATIEMAWGTDTVIDWERQKVVLQESLRRCKDSTNGLPQEIQVYADSGSPALHTAANSQPRISRDPVSSLMNMSTQAEDEQPPEQRRQTQHEIQRANIYASSLSTRSYIVETYWSLKLVRDRTRSPSSASHSTSPGSRVTATGLDTLTSKAPSRNHDTIEQEMLQERENITKDLLRVLGNISEVNMEPNADNFTMKIRSLASSLLDIPDQRKSQLTLDVQDDLSAFLKDLTMLERAGSANSDLGRIEDDTHQQRAWADLRQRQTRLAQRSGG